MRTQLAVLQEVFAEWMWIHQFGSDYHFYTGEEWQKREGSDGMLSGAELVLVFENELVSQINYANNHDTEEELQEIAAGFGYYFELGTIWNMGFYPLEGWPALPPHNASYTTLLRDSRWRTRRQRIIARARGHCESCSKKHRLEVHHCYYRYGRYPWQYPDRAFLALCEACHEERGLLEMRWRVFMPLLKNEELHELHESLQATFSQYDREAFFKLLALLGDANISPDLLIKRLIETRKQL